MYYCEVSGIDDLNSCGAQAPVVSARAVCWANLWRRNPRSTHLLWEPVHVRIRQLVASVYIFLRCVWFAMVQFHDRRTSIRAHFVDSDMVIASVHVYAPASSCCH